LKPVSVSTKQERIAELARENPAMAFTSLNQYLDAEWLEYAFECTRKDGAVGVDGQTAESYAANLQQNLASLIERLKSGRYRAPPVRRHYIPKAGGGERGLGIPAFEDKVAQRAITMLLEPIYEQTFLDCSFGYRPARNAHQALQVLRDGIMKRRGHWVLEVDIRKYFDSIPFAALRECLAKRVTDGVVRRLIDKWLKAGVLEAGQVHYPEAGTPQGGVISPILSNVFLHYVIDQWYTEQVRPRLRGPSTLVRFCDDFVMCFTHKADAERVLVVLDKRLGRFGLQLHPDKTRLVDFRPRRSVGEIEESTLPTTFNFLGFTHEHLDAAGLTTQDVQVFLDALTVIAKPVSIYFTWRPQLTDPVDEMVLETAINGQAKALVTFNRRDFGKAPAAFGIELLLPSEALRRLR
jgi:RNA-directed DNA polymerase